MGNFSSSMKIFMLSLLASHIFCTTVLAADWLSLQGTEPEGASRATIWGFVQPRYTHMEGTRLKGGGWAGQDAVFNTLPPDFKNESGFQLSRARLGVRGTVFPQDNNINYFLLAEFGDNGVTATASGIGRMADASVTFNHLKQYTRVRIGQFKTPGSEDGMQAIHVHNYINFSLPAHQLLLEPFRDSNGADPSSPNLNLAVPGEELCKNSTNPEPSSAEYWAICENGNGLNGSVGAFRDIGVQFFNTHTIKDGPGAYPWEISYAFMVGNGNGIARRDNDNEREYYYYLSTGQVFGGVGPRRDDWKVYAWLQDGKRTIFDSGSSANREFDRERWGVGGTYRKGKYRLYGEYVEADGMIPNATTGAAIGGTLNTAVFSPAAHPAGSVVSTFNTLANAEAKGWYLDFGYMALPNLELDVRYDELDRGTGTVAGAERDFKRWTLGAQYFFKKQSRFTLNYEFRDTEAPNDAGADNIVSGTDDMFTAQILVIF
jgi:hypothetical protein